MCKVIEMFWDFGHKVLSSLTDFYSTAELSTTKIKRNDWVLYSDTNGKLMSRMVSGLLNIASHNGKV